MIKKPVIIISGPTGSGKSSLSIELAKRLNTEIISSDSMQIYRNMNIGTAKITEGEMSGIKHHLLDIIDAKDEFSVKDFQQMALFLIDDIHDREMIPIVVGGSGLYINSIYYKYDFSDVVPNKDFRDEMEVRYSKNPEELLDKLMSIDSELYGSLTVKDKKKIIRALEVYKFSKKKISVNSELNSDYAFHLYVITDEREKLYESINLRVDRMIEQGLIEEVKTLMEEGLNENHQSMKAIGYREIIPYLQGSINKSEMIEKLKQDSRRYAKRQLTWFRKIKEARWLDKSNMSKEEMIDKIIGDIDGFPIFKG